ncbi:hypothetical protein [Streptomyces sp. NBC_00038]|uniref:hypothetical protein n=1 Tax=Streptomyces sp. NBC_00038 TaxID=2903615 RepID=UPI00225166E7|nr:hypothetical protein [Streptomyces sp. NBC_00038]MCX5562027.1 hypothetical protein [Streptomyces sp. NBC_00038]
MTLAQGIFVAVVTAVVGVPFAGLIACWGVGDTGPEASPPRGRGSATDVKGVTLDKDTANTRDGWDGEATLGCCVALVVGVAIVLVELAVADPGPNDGHVRAVATIPVLMAAAVPVLRYRKGVRGLLLAVHASGALTLAAACLSVAAFVTGRPPYATGWILLALVAAGLATTSVLALVRAQVTLTVVPVAVAVLVVVFGAIAHSEYDSPGYAMRFGHPVRMPLPSLCVAGEGMGCAITWDEAQHGSSPAFAQGQVVAVHFSPEASDRYGRYYGIGGFYEPGDDNDPTQVFLDTRAVGDDAYVTLGYRADSFTPLGRLRLPGLMWAALLLLLCPLALHLFLVRDRAAQPLRRRRTPGAGGAAAVTRHGERV